MENCVVKGKMIRRHCRNCEYHKPAFLFDVWCDMKYKWQRDGRKSALFCRCYKKKTERKIDMEKLVEALKRYDSLETVIAELEAFDDDGGRTEVTIDELTDYLNDEADYASY